MSTEPQTWPFDSPPDMGCFTMQGSGDGYPPPDEVLQNQNQRASLAQRLTSLRVCSWDDRREAQVAEQLRDGDVGLRTIAGRDHGVGDIHARAKRRRKHHRVGLDRIFQGQCRDVASEFFASVSMDSEPQVL